MADIPFARDFMRRSRYIGSIVGRAAAVGLLFGPAVVPSVARCQGERSWYVIRMAGVPVGWMHHVRVSGDSGILVATSTRLVLNRLGASVVMEMRGRSLETSRGALLHTDGVMQLSDQATEIHAMPIADSVRLRTRAGGRDFERVLAAPRALLCPAGAE
jgi:hypothetical protein